MVTWEQFVRSDTICAAVAMSIGLKVEHVPLP